MSVTSLTARQFADWWEARRCESPWWERGLAESFRWWWAPRERELSEDEEQDILDELERRGMIYTDHDGDPDAGMVITSLEITPED